MIYVAVHENQPTEPTEPPVTVIYGDADGDGIVTAMDVTQIQRYLSNMVTSVTDENKAVCDVDGDGNITIMDVTYIQRWLANMNIPENVHIG